MRQQRRALVSGGAPFDPLSLAHLELYLRSDQVTGVNGASISTWPDLSGNARDYGQGTGVLQPKVLVPGSGNGTRLVRFDGASDPNGDNMGATYTLPNQTRGYTFYFYGAFHAPVNANNGAVLYATFAGGRPNLIIKEAGASTWGWQDNGGSHFAGTHPCDGSTQTLIYHFPPAAGVATGTAYKGHDGTTSDVTAVWNYDGSVPTSAEIGDNNNPGVVACKMDLGACLIYSDSHDAPTRLLVANYLIDFFEG